MSAQGSINSPSAWVVYVRNYSPLLHKSNQEFQSRAPVSNPLQLIKPTMVKSKKTKKKKNTDVLSKIYYDPKHPAGYGGAKKLKKAATAAASAPIPSTWLKGQLAYTLHKPLIKKFPTRSYKTSGINELWQLDLMEMVPYAKANKGYKYILTCIDVFSRYGRAIPLKSKKGDEVASALESMLRDNEIPFYMQTDMGKEFYNSHVRSVLAKHGIRHYSVHSQFKAALVERWNRTMRERLNRYFTHKGDKVWHNVLDDIVHSYNHSKHRGIGNMRPVDVNSRNEAKLWSQQQQPVTVRDGHINLLDYVRVSRMKGPFLKNFDQNWSEEVFRVIAIDNKQSPIMYALQDLQGNVIQGRFYKQELQSLGSDPPSLYRIEKIIRSRDKGKNKQYLVKWLGYDSSHNSWITASQINI